ncbi:MAG: class I tRNA ligase family protein, partial [Chloroflexi bacterium]|nr:class I tRNA ligase family protein [Chloroflexota bacterium]
RIAPNELKESPLDFTLWKGAKEGEPSWDSPWGPGRPGWHIECSAMSLSYLGEKIDIHGGGADLIFPHHENEIAQTEAFTGTAPFAQYWLHNGLLQMGEEKMSKSLGNLVSIRDVVEQHGADAFRLFVLTSHYRMPLTWTDDGVAASARAAERLSRAAWASSGEGDAPDVGVFRERFYEAMDDDLNTPQALAALFDMTREINRAAGDGADVSEACVLLRELGGVLGLRLEQPGTAGGEGDAAPFVELLIETRTALRKEKQFALADNLRDQLAELGVVLEDTARGTEWRYEQRESR